MAIFSFLLTTNRQHKLHEIHIKYGNNFNKVSYTQYNPPPKKKTTTKKPEH